MFLRLCSRAPRIRICCCMLRPYRGTVPHAAEAEKQLSRRTPSADPPDLQFFHTRSASPSDGTIAHMIRVDFGPGMANLHAALAVICECVSETGPATMIAHSASVRSLPQRKCFRLIAGAAAAQAQERNRKARGSRSDLLAILDRMSPARCPLDHPSSSYLTYTLASGCDKRPEVLPRTHVGSADSGWLMPLSSGLARRHRWGQNGQGGFAMK